VVELVQFTQLLDYLTLICEEGNCSCVKKGSYVCLVGRAEEWGNLQWTFS